MKQSEKLKMRFPQNERDEDNWLNFIIEELPDDPYYPGSAKSAAEMHVRTMIYGIENLKELNKDQAKQLTHMERRNVKLNQKITRLVRQLKDARKQKPMRFKRIGEYWVFVDDPDSPVNRSYT